MNNDRKIPHRSTARRWFINTSVTFRLRPAAAVLQTLKWKRFSTNTESNRRRQYTKTKPSRCSGTCCKTHPNRVRALLLLFAHTMYDSITTVYRRFRSKCPLLLATANSHTRLVLRRLDDPPSKLGLYNMRLFGWIVILHILNECALIALRLADGLSTSC